MGSESIETLIIGGGQAGLAASAQLTRRGLPHLVIERGRIAERWRSERWDTLVTNGPAWNDRFPDQTYDGADPDSFPGKADVADYFERFATAIAAPIRTGVAVKRLSRNAHAHYVAQTDDGVIVAENVIVATGPFQKPVIPPLIPDAAGLTQLHSAHYKNPGQLPDGGVLVIGAGSSGVQIADELNRAGKRVWLAVGRHSRPPRRYRGRDFVWWLDVLGRWALPPPSTGPHVTIALSGARGGHTVDFRALAHQGVTLTGVVTGYAVGRIAIADDLQTSIAAGDADYLGTLREADGYVARVGLDLPEEPGAYVIAPDPACLTDPLTSLDLHVAGVTSVIWATGYAYDFGWIDVDVFGPTGAPRHQRGVSASPGLHFLGLPGLSNRASAFIWGVWHDAAHLADHIAAQTVKA